MGLLLEKSEKTGAVTIKKIISGGAADEDGRLKLKDELLRVDGKALEQLALEEVQCSHRTLCFNLMLAETRSDCCVVSDS